MATAFTKIDALGLYLSGATVAGGGQPLPASALGGYRSSKEVQRLGFVVRGGFGIKPIRIDWISGSNGTGRSALNASGTTSLIWDPYDATAGTAVSVANGETKLIESNTVAKSIRVTRMSSDTPKGNLAIDVVDVFNDLLGFSNISSDDATAGKANYRAAFIRNHSGATITDIKVWIKTLGTQRVSGTAQLGSSGSGTITTATASGFADWPTSGWCHIKNAGTTREIVYYTSRTSTSLTVPAAGRGRLGTSAAAGANTDTIDAVPGIRVGLEAPSSDAIQTIANETTAPTGITWNAQTTSATGVSIASLAASADYGLWIHRDTPAGMVAGAQIRNSLNIEFVYSATTYSTVWSGLYRCANNALRLYELYSGTDTSPDLTATAATTSATLPFNHALTPPGSGNRTYHIVVRYRNAYGLTSLNRYERKTKIDSTGALVVKNPSAPTNMSLQGEIGGGGVYARAHYTAIDDDPVANTWAIYLANGSNPTGSETPILVPMTIENGGLFRRNVRPLSYLIGTFISGADVRALIRTRHSASGAESTNTTPATITTTTGPVGLPRVPMFGPGFGQIQRGASLGVGGTKIISAPYNVYLSWDSGYLDLWVGTDHIFRIRYDSSGAANNGIWTTYAFAKDVISGTPTSEPIDVVSATELYITSNGVRRMKIDRSAGTISFTSMDKALTRRSSNSSQPVFDATFQTLFQVYDPYAGDYATALDLDSDGTLRMNVPWRRAGTVGDFN
ncbi:MAG: hypothetical protein IT366_21520 [Candidatus Hydrogenedentes bacterium]|nr:hypothetical protein [Candidatus Hydrogenedentota bacterium]